VEQPDDLDVLIAAVEAEFQLVHGSERVEFAVGDLESEEHGTWPRIEWREPEGTIGPPRMVGGFDPDRGVDANDQARPTPSSIATMKPSVQVACWGRNRAKARELVKHLILATTRINKFGLAFTRYEIDTDRHKKSGVKFVLFGEFELSVPAETANTVGYITLRAHAWDVTEKGETVHGENEVVGP